MIAVAEDDKGEMPDHTYMHSFDNQLNFGAFQHFLYTCINILYMVYHDLMSQARTIFKKYWSTLHLYVVAQTEQNNWKRFQKGP
jgi:hypothetical protein